MSQKGDVFFLQTFSIVLPHRDEHLSHAPRVRGGEFDDLDGFAESDNQSQANRWVIMFARKYAYDIKIENRGQQQTTPWCSYRT